MSSRSRKSSRLAGWAALVVGSVAALTACGAPEFSSAEVAEWLRIAGDYDESPEEVACVARAMNDLLSEQELEQWLSQDPTTITVDEIQALPRAIDIADRCR